MITCVPVPTAAGVYVTVHMGLLAVGPRVHGDPLKVPVPLLVNETVPVGEVAPMSVVSPTPTVHVMG